MIDKPISSLNPLSPGQIPLDPNTIIEIALPNILSPTGFDSYKCKLSELASSIASGTPVYTAKDTTNISVYDSGYNFVPMGKLLGDIKRVKGLAKF